jgi:RNA polymerase sigma-70 factor (ECF subfamily)
LARTHLDTRIRQKVDAEDVVQSVFRSFFLRHADGQFDLKDWGSLWGLLALITVRKCARQNRHFHGPEHDVRKEVAAVPAADDSATGWEALDREPTAEEAVALAETVEHLLRGLSGRNRVILELRLQGYTVPEISERVGVTEFTVEGRLKQLRKRLRAQVAPAP